MPPVYCHWSEEGRADSFTPNILEETLKRNRRGSRYYGFEYHVLLESKLFYVNPELPVVDMVFMCEYLAEN